TSPHSRPHPSRLHPPPVRRASSPLPPASLSGSRCCLCPPHRRCPRCPPPRTKDRKNERRSPSRPRCHTQQSHSNHFERVRPVSSPLLPASVSGPCCCLCPRQRHCRRCPPLQRKSQK